MRQVFVFIALFFTVQMAPAAEKPTDFAYGITIDATGSEALYDVTLPPSVYQGVTRRDLADVRVFNGAGEVVPHAWRPRRTEKAEAGATLPLTLFPLKAAPGANLDALSIRVNRSAGGAVTVDVKSGGAPAASAQTVAYLIDVSAQERALRAIDLDWKAGDGFAGKLRVDASDDLSNWHALVSDAPLMNLEVGGQLLQQKRVELPQRKAKYLRLAWVHDAAKTAYPEITMAKGELADKFIEAPREWMPVKAQQGIKEAMKDGDYIFDFKGFFPADRFRIGLPETNTIVPFEMLVRDKPEQPWRSITRGVAYRLNQAGNEVLSPDIQTGAIAERWLMLRVDQRGGGMGASLPTLSAGWVPHQLVFAARGKAPFTLAYGNAGNNGAKSSALPIESLIPGYREDAGVVVRTAKTSGNVTVNVQAAAAQGQTELGGAVRLEQQVDWKRWSLWAVLGLGVVILGAMAWRLMRQLGTSGGAGGVDKS